MNHCAELIASDNCGHLWSCLQSVYQAPVPSPGCELAVSYSDNKVVNLENSLLF